MFVLNGLVRAVSRWPPEGLNNALIRFLNQVVGSWAMFLAALGGLRTVAITLVSINVLGVVINVLVLASLFYLIAREARMAVGMAG